MEEVWDVQSIEVGDMFSYWSSWYGAPLRTEDIARAAYDRIVNNPGRVAKDVRLVKMTPVVIEESRDYKYGTNK